MASDLKPAPEAATAAPEKRLRILVVCSAVHLEDYFTKVFLENSGHDFEIVSGDRSDAPSPHAASRSRLLELRQRLERGEFDLVISGPIMNSAWPHPKSFPRRLAAAFRYLIRERSKLDTYWTPWLLSRVRGKVPLAVIDPLDSSHVLPKDFPLLKACTLYFKLNLYFWPRRSLMPLETYFSMRRVTAHTPKLRPLTRGIARGSIPQSVRPMRERDIDICFTGTMIPERDQDDFHLFPDGTFNPIRRDIYERCAKLKDRYKVFCVDGTVPPKEYAELLQRSKLVVCTESFGCETSRIYDAAAAGAVPLVNWPFAQNHLPLQPGIHALYFSLVGDDFERTVARALVDAAKLEEIATNARAFTIAHKEHRLVGEAIINETLREQARLSV